MQKNEKKKKMVEDAMQAAEASFQNQDIPGQKFKAVSAKTTEQVVKWKLNFM